MPYDSQAIVDHFDKFFNLLWQQKIYEFLRDRCVFYRVPPENELEYYT